jgi:glycolate oxidase subunit GlcD
VAQIHGGTEQPRTGYPFADPPDPGKWDVCIHCGMCLDSCPTYQEKQLEPHSPRGRVHLIKAVGEGRMELNTGLADPIFECLDCRACETACPSGVRVGALIEEARGQWYQASPPTGWKGWVSRFFLQTVFPHPSRLHLLGKLLRWYQRSGLQRLVRTSGLLRLLPSHLAQMEAVLPSIPRRPSRKSLGERLPAQGEKRSRVALLTGCVMDVMYAGINEATARVLQRNGCEVTVPRGQRCCGALQVHAGDRETAKRLARQNIEAFLETGADRVIVNAAGCGAALKEYGELLKHDPHYREKAESFAAKVIDISAFLSEEGFEPPQGELRGTAVYHDACHLAHGQGVRREPRDLLRSIPGLKLLDLPDADRCCGSAGVYNLTHPEMAERLLARKVDDIPDGVDWVVMGNPGCMLQVASGIRQRSGKEQVVHTVQLLDWAYNGVDNRNDPSAPTEKGDRIPTGVTEVDAIVQQLTSILGKHGVLHRREDLLAYECDAYTVTKGMPRAVVFPETTRHVAEVVRLLHEQKIPFIPRGAGTGLSGGATPRGGEVIISLARMNRLLEVDIPNRRAVVQPGYVNLHLTQAVQGDGYYYAPDPSSQQACTIGGNVGENAGGAHCLKYGVTTNHVLGLEMVLPDGEIVRLGGLLEEPGLDLTGLVTGSEGTLGIVTEITVRLMKQPEGVQTVLALFDRIEDASAAVSEIIASGILPAALEMMDTLAIEGVERGTFPVGYPEGLGAVLIAEVDGVAAGLADQIKRIVEVCQHHHVREVRTAASEEERKSWWANRKTAFGAMGTLAPDYLVQDGVIPRTRLPEVLAKIAEIGREKGVRIANVFHAGDGNLHPLILFDSKVPGEQERAVAAGSAILKVCTEVGGSITGEHGVGLEKQEEMRFLFTEEELSVMTEVRSVFNPHGRCNPGKMFPSPAKCGEVKRSARPEPVSSST